MKNAAMVLGIIGGVVGMVVGFFGYGWTEVAGWFSSVSDGLSDKVIENDNPDRVRFVSLFAPILSIAGGAMSPGRPLIGAVLTAQSHGLTPYATIGYRYMFLICLAGGALSLAAAFFLKETLEK